MLKQYRKELNFHLTCSEQVAKALIHNLNSGNKYVVVNENSASDIHVELKWESHGHLRTEYIFEANIVDGSLMGVLYTPGRQQNHESRKFTLNYISQALWFNLVGPLMIFGIPILLGLLIFQNSITGFLSGTILSSALIVIVLVVSNHMKIHLQNLRQLLSPLSVEGI